MRFNGFQDVFEQFTDMIANQNILKPSPSYAQKLPTSLV
jgi:hypothetical protein